MKWFSHILAWLVLCIAVPAHAAAPNSVQVTYDIYKGSIKIGEIEEVYTRDKDHYTLSSITKPVGIFAVFKPEKVFVNSRGLVGKQGLKPLHFDHRREQDASKDSSAEFDWEKGELTQIHQEQRDMVALPEGTQDRLSAMYQFMFLPNSATVVDFPMTNGIRLNNYHYAVSRGQKLKTPAGEFSTLYLDDQAKSGERHNEIWLATQRYNLPCKMVITEANGDQLTQVLSKLQIR
ncbi:hypothetical protein FGKAn22_18240 [Ferrigenium kumadai]|uniref:DUF3108 domain-containing protein n=1 Tax=Ferrigenium kumadai TaxID=1682490 RepID=A0AAN1W0W5_9PROT|nr:DUF3108 domain-containing protein [Ferrigenium kumadai]BBJ00132.1 hypothetical protein FGKAn22_18240 [Ferrigenium kumadai]